MSLLSPVPRKATTDRSGLVRTNVTETNPVVTAHATHTAAVAALQTGIDTATGTADAAASDATAALAAANAAVAAADAFPIASFLGTISSLSQDPGNAGTNDGKWWAIEVSGTLTHPNADSAVVATGERLLASGSGWNVYPVPPTYVPDSSLVKAKLAPAIRRSLTVADDTATEWMNQTVTAEGAVDPAVGNAEGTEGTTRIAGEAISASGTITEASFYAGRTGSAQVRVYSKVGSVFTLEASASVEITSVGLVTVTDLSIPVEAGWYVGFYSLLGRINQENGAAGKSLWVYSGDASTSATFTQYSPIQLQIGWTLLTSAPRVPAAVEFPRAQLDATARASLDTADWVASQIVALEDVAEGVTTLAGDVTTSTGTTRIYGAAAAVTGTITEIRLWANGAGSMDLRVYSRSGSTFTLLQSTTVSVILGENTIAVSLPITAGQYVGVYAETAGLGQKNDGSGEGIWTASGDADPSGTFTEFATVKCMIGWTTARQVISVPQAASPLQAPEIEVIQAATQVRIFVPSASGACVEYVLSRSTGGTRQDVWRISATYIVTRNGAHDYARDRFGGISVVDDGAWEFAAMVSGAGDWVGTWHGHEEQSSAIHFRDGAKAPAGSANHTCREWELVQRSTVYRYGTATPLAYRTMRLTFTAAGIRCRQRVEWAASVTLDHAYLAMLPIERVVGEDDTQVTDAAIVGPLCAEQNVATGGFTEVISATGDFIRAWGATSGVSARMEMATWGTATHNAWVAGSEYYNKFYFDHGPGQNVTASSVWNAEWTAAVETTLA